MLVSFTAAAALASFGQGVVQTSPDDRYRIGFQDVLSIEVFRHPELNGTRIVNPNGTIDLYRLDKPIVAACKTERELALDIQAAYKVSYLVNPLVTVRVVEQRSQTLSVIGAVEKPGPYQVGRQLSLLQLLALAGGPNKEAGTRLYVVRGGSTSACRQNEGDEPATDALVAFKISDLYQGKKNLKMLPGDVVTVLKSDIIYVYGNVTKPGAIEVREPITLTQAIASGEGLAPAADKKEVRILRQKPDSLEREEIIVNLSAIEKGKEKDPYLEPNDIVAVSKDKMKDILGQITKVITGAAGTSLGVIPTIIGKN